MEFALLPEGNSLSNFAFDGRIRILASGNSQTTNVKKAKEKKQGQRPSDFASEHYLGRSIEVQENIASLNLKVNDFAFASKSA